MSSPGESCRQMRPDFMLGKQIFFDPTGKRARLLRRLAWGMGTISAVVFIAFGATLMVVHHPASAALEGSQVSIRCAWAPTCSTAHALYVTNAADPEAVKAATSLAVELREKERALRALGPRSDDVNHRPIPHRLDNPADRALSIGFYVNWDDNSYAALKRALPNLDWVIPSWLTLSGKTMDLHPDIDERARAEASRGAEDTHLADDSKCGGGRLGRNWTCAFAGRSGCPQRTDL
jgi:peptidoglycan-N-acetylglucosamine deacetylase